MSLNIFKLKKGDHIVFKYPRAGYNNDQKIAKENLVLDELYVVEDFHIGDWLTLIKLKDFPGIEFNSVQFEFE